MRVKLDTTRTPTEPATVASSGLMNQQSTPRNQRSAHPVPNYATRRRLSPGIRWLRFTFRMLDRIAPGLGAKRAYRLWFETPRYPEPTRETRWREQAMRFSVATAEGPLAVYRWSDGPMVLLVHGWSGRATQMAAFAAPLAAAGYGVVAFDAPGHGRSPGTHTTIFRMADALRAVANEVGPIKGIVAHSFGSLVVALAMRQGLQAEKVVCISSPTSARFLVDRFCSSLTIPERTKQLFTQRLEQRFGENIWTAVSADENARHLPSPALIIHADDDHEVPWQLGERLADAWPGARFLRTHGLGHRRILRDRKVIQAVMEFLAD